ncbi:MAG: hypothetical protein IJM24_01430 [Clostridia bacterium]|nr:hypothetical protein [Clostridia bacterium]
MIDVVHARCGLKNERECGRMSDSGQRGMKRTKMQESLTTAGRNDKITTVRRTGALPQKNNAAARTRSYE